MRINARNILEDKDMKSAFLIKLYSKNYFYDSIYKLIFRPYKSIQRNEEIHHKLTLVLFSIFIYAAAIRGTLDLHSYYSTSNIKSCIAN